LGLLLVAASLSWGAACGRSGLWGRDAAVAADGTGGGDVDVDVDVGRDVRDASPDRGADVLFPDVPKPDMPSLDVPAEAGHQPDAGTDRMVDANLDRGLDRADDRAPEAAPALDASRVDGLRADKAPVTWPVDAAGMLSLVAGQLGGFGAHDGVGPATRFDFPRGVTSDGRGNLFVADTNNQSIRRVEIATRKVTTLAGSPGESGAVDGVGPEARFDGPEGIAYDGAGNLLVADTLNHTIRKVVVATGAVTTLAGAAGQSGDADGNKASARFTSPRGLAWDGAGALFISDSSGHYGQALRKLVIATGEVTTVADVAPGPMGLAADQAGNLFVADSLVIRKVVVATGVVTTLAGNPDRASAADGTGTNASFGSIMSLAYDGAGGLIVADSWDGPMIRRVVIATGEVSTMVSQADAAKACPWEITSKNFIMVSPSLGVASDGAGKIYATVLYNGTLCEIDPSTKTVTTLAGAAPAPGNTDGVGRQARINGPTGLSTDGAGHLFAVDRCGLRQVGVGSSEVSTLADGACGRYGGGFAGFETDTVSDGKGNLLLVGLGTIESLVVDSGVLTSVVGSRGKYGTSDGTGPDASFAAGPSNLAYDGKGALFVAQAHTTSIRRLETATGTVTTLVLLAKTVPPLSAPAGLLFDPSGALFVSDADRCAVYKVVLGTGELTLLAGSPGECGFADGTGAAARFRAPGKMASDGAGNLYVADPDNHAVRKVVLATGTVTTVVGAAEPFDIVIPGALPAHLNRPSGLAYVPGAGLFIADVNENAILLAGL
jgi:hypothetical protein